MWFRRVTGAVTGAVEQSTLLHILTPPISGKEELRRREELAYTNCQGDERECEDARERWNEDQHRKERSTPRNACHLDLTEGRVSTDSPESEWKGDKRFRCGGLLPQVLRWSREKKYLALPMVRAFLPL